MTRTLPFHSKPKTRQRPEARLQKALVQILRLQCNPGVLWFSIPNERRTSPRIGAELKAMGLRPGAADLCFVIEGRARFLELKAEKGRLTDEQKGFCADAYSAGGEYLVAFRLEEAIQILSDWGVFSPAKSAKVAA